MKTISPKQLGTLADPEHCKRCFWLHHRMKFKAPYSMFPGIFSTLDRYQKNVTIEHMKMYGRVPAWLNVFGEFKAIEPSPHWSKFSITLPNGLVFRGAADTLLRKTDGSLFILDEKTAKPKEAGHRLERMYNIQLNGYAKIANALGMGPVTGLGIVYNVPQQFSEEEEVTIDHMLTDIPEGQYTMLFKPVTRDVALDEEYLDRLIGQAAELIDRETCPMGKPGCKNCGTIDQLVTLTRLVEEGA